jgi:phosphoglycolate phosphatase
VKYDLAAFDFDGTLADTFPWFDSIMDGVADKYGFRKATPEEKASMRHQEVHQVLKFLGIPIWKAPMILIHIRKLMKEIEPEVHLFEGAGEALLQLKTAGLKLAVVSSNSLDNVQRVLGEQTVALVDYFECGADVFGKAAKIKRLLAHQNTPPERVILIGDELRDIEAARETGVHAGSVAWGYNDVAALRERAPDELFMKVDELVRLAD